MMAGKKILLYQFSLLLVFPAMRICDQLHYITTGRTLPRHFLREVGHTLAR